MTGTPRIERDLPRILAELGSGGEPDYTDSLLARTEGIRQRPGWVFLERWIPMNVVSERVLPPRVPLRAIASVGLLVLVIAVSAALLVGALQRRLPPPYGPAGNGLVVYDLWATGDIYVGDPVLGQRRQITSGPGFDSGPGFSRDGTRLAFLRAESADARNSGRLMVVNADGSGLRPVTSRQFESVSDADWSGDGRTILFVSSVSERSVITVVDVETGSTRDLDVGMPVVDVEFRPPTRDKLLFVGELGGDGAQVMSIVDTGGSEPREIVRSPKGVQDPQWSPDGSRIAYSRVEDDGRVSTHLVEVDSGAERVLPNPAGVIYQLTPKWSPDGTSLLIGRGYWNGATYACCPEPDRYALAIIPVDGSVPAGRELGVSDFSFGNGWDWSPDGSKVVTTHGDSFSTLDLATGEQTTYDGWLSAAWQRVKR